MLNNDGYLVFLFPQNPRQLLASLQNDYADEVISSAWITHGLATCILALAPDFEIDTLLEALSREGLTAYEVWPFRDQGLDQASIHIWRAPSEGHCTLPGIPSEDLPEPIAQEIRQFNSNLALFESAARDHLPEYEDLITWLRDSVERRIGSIREQVRNSEHVSSLGPKLHNDVSILVDVNSCLTMVISQSAGVVPPIFHSTYPVGEFSLLGIGSAARAAWRFYESIADVFSRADHVTRLRSSFQTGPFDPGFTPADVDYDSWKDAATRSVPKQAPENMRPGRKHLVYFSSRWGFHETLNSISVSWQSITSCATRHWNLLTLTHEFLHSHFRELVRTNILDVRDSYHLEEVSRRYISMQRSGWNGRDGAGRSFSYLDSFRAFLLTQLDWCDQAARWREGGSDDPSFLIHELEPDEIVHLINKQMAEYLEEYVVHILDFHYFFDGDDDAYLSSLWHSWSLVPFVHKKLHHYLLRSLLALGSTVGSNDPKECFVSAWKRLEQHFITMLDHSNNPIAADALGLLRGKGPAEKLYIDFNYSFLLIPFSRQFLIDPLLNERLTFDPLTTDTQSFGIMEGEFLATPITSPSAFLLDRYEHSHGEDESVSYASLWQLLMIL